MIKLNAQYNYRDIKRVTFDSGNRYYVCPDSGEHLPSVTTILDHTADKTYLLEWKARVGEKKAESVKREAVNLGSLVHTHLENWVMGIDRPKGSHPMRVLSAKMADIVIEKGLSKVDEVWGLEKPLYLPSLYAGTADLLGVYKGKPAIMDYKSARKMKKKEDIIDYYHQMTAYIMAHNWAFDTNIQMGVVFMVDRDGNFNEYVLEGDYFHTCCEQWEQRIIDYHAMNLTLS